jgi:putative transposase
VAGVKSSQNLTRSNMPMKNDTPSLPFRQSETILDPLSELAREGARRMLAEALKAEADAFVASFLDEQLEDGRQRIVRHGFGPERQIQTGIGALDVQRPKVRDRLATSDPSTKIRFRPHRKVCS